MSDVSVYTYLEPFRNGPSLAAVTALVDEVGDLDRCLIGYHSNGPDGWILGAHTLGLSDSLKVLLAHRPGVMQPTVAARMAATLSAVSGGRAALHIVNGGAPGDQYREGDYLGHDDRYRRAKEYVDVMRKVWSATEPFSHEGEFYKFEDVRPGVRPADDIVIHMGGASAAALEFGGAQADVYMLWGEPQEQVRERIAAIEDAAARAGRQRPRISLSVRTYLGSTDQQAWEMARSEPAYRDFVARGGGVSTREHSQDAGRNRQLQFARESEVHDDCLWMGIVAALNGLGNAAALVGTDDRVLSSLQAYADLGVDTFLIGGEEGDWQPHLTPFVRRIRQEIRLPDGV